MVWLASEFQQVRVVDEVGHGLLEIVAALLSPPLCEPVEDAFLPGMGVREKFVPGGGEQCLTTASIVLTRAERQIARMYRVRD